MAHKNIFERLTAVLLGILSVLLFAMPAFAQNSKNELTVGVPVDRCPIFYIDEKTKEITGIGADLMLSAAESAGYTVKFEKITEPTLKEAIDNSEYDVVMPFGSAIESAKGKKIVVSDNFFQTPFTLVTLEKREVPRLNSLKVGMLKSQGGVVQTVMERFPHIEVELYNNIDESVKALRKGEIDALLQNSYVWSYVLQKPAYSDLIVHPSEMFSMDFRAGAPDTEEGRAIINRLNGGISHISDTQIQAVTLDYTSRKLYKYTPSDFCYKYGLVIVLGALLLLAVLVITLQRFYSIRKDHEEKIREIIDHDPLTGVLSKTGFRKRVEELLRENPGTPYFLSYNNIRDFKYINDSLGRIAGDDLLKFWSAKSLENLSDKEAIGRINADRFAVLRMISSDKDMRRDEEVVFEPVQNFFINQGKDNRVQISSGIYVLTPDDFKNIDFDHMLDLARVAEKRVREEHEGDFAFYNPEQWNKGKRVAEIISDLSAAIEKDEIEVYYQPQVNYNTGRITGAEALCRWKHSKLGWIQPSEFITALEEAGLIFELDKIVWEKVCKDLRKWEDIGYHRSVSVNVSRGDIREDRDICEHFNKLIQTYRLTPDQLRIEITESAYVESPELIIEATKKLRSFGFKVEMDDFGSGYSSLHMLKDVPVDCIKLDLHFLTSSGDPEKSHTIVSCIIQMVRMLGLELITEGVETVEQARFLQSMGASIMQGYYFFKPMPLEDFEKTLREYEKD